MGMNVFTSWLQEINTLAILNESRCDICIL